MLHAEELSGRAVASDLVLQIRQFSGTDKTADACRMKEGQKDIFYMAADSLDAASSAPFVERLVQKDFEVSCLWLESILIRRSGVSAA